MSLGKRDDLEERLEGIDLPPAYRRQILNWFWQREVFEKPRSYSPDEPAFFKENPLMGHYDTHYDFGRKEFTAVIAEALINAIDIKRRENPARYNAVSEMISTLIQETGDKLILPVHSKKINGVTRNSSNGNGGVYDVQILLPNGEHLDIIAKHFENEADFDVDVHYEDTVGDGLLAVDEKRRIKLELNKGKTTLTEKIADSDADERINLCHLVAERVIKDIKQTERKREAFEAETDRPQRIYDWLADVVTGKRYDKGKRYVVPEVEDFTEDFLERFVFRLAPDLKEECYSKGKLDKRALRKQKPLWKLYRILKRDFEPVFQKQRRHVINSDLNAGNVLFDDTGRVKTCDSELMRVDLVQKCAYDITEKQRLPYDVEMKIAERFHANLDTGVDRETFMEIYRKRKILEDLAFTKNLEYAGNEIRADSPRKKKLFEEAARYYFNRACGFVERAYENSGKSGVEFLNALNETIELMGLSDKLSRVGCHLEYDDLEARVLGCEEINMTKDPLENLKVLVSTELNTASNRLRYRRYAGGESKVKSRLVWSGAAGLFLACLVGGTRLMLLADESVVDKPNRAIDARYLQRQNPSNESTSIDDSAIRHLEETLPDYTEFLEHIKMEDNKIEHYGVPHTMIDHSLNHGYSIFGLPRRLFNSVIMANAAQKPNPEDFSGRTGPLLVPKAFIKKNLMYPRADDDEIFSSGLPHFAMSSRYMKTCMLANDGNIIGTIAEYYLGRDKMTEAIMKARTQDYFDLVVDVTAKGGDIVTPGYRNHIGEKTRDLIDTAVYFYIHTNGNLVYHPKMRFPF
jgi:hypothetical protein